MRQSADDDQLDAIRARHRERIRARDDMIANGFRPNPKLIQLIEDVEALLGAIDPKKEWR